MKRTGWIPASKSPVRDGWYEWLCMNYNYGSFRGKIVRVEWTGESWVPLPYPSDRPRADCPGCQWRGLTKPATEAK